jgi:hypothetical protein
LGERRLCKAEVRGSSPLISTWAAKLPLKKGLTRHLSRDWGSKIS